MSTAQAALSPAWKQEVNRRIAEHRSRKASPSLGQDASSDAHRTLSGSRAAEAAARVAERFANAPSYSEMLAEEARAAVRAAEFASRAALRAQVAAESVLAGLEASAAEFAPIPPVPPSSQASWQPAAEAIAPVDRRPSPAPAETPFASPHERMHPFHSAAPEPIREHGIYEVLADQTFPPALIEAEPPDLQSAQAAEMPQPLHANLIEFPRELVATRKVRPRIAEGPFGAVREPGSQLSIFEVDPDAVSTLPAAADALPQTAPAWTEPEWSGIELDAQPVVELVEEIPQAVMAEPVAAVHALDLAPMSRSLLAAVVDGALVVAAFLVAAFAAAANAKTLPGPREAELAAAGALLVVAALYHAFFFTFARATPGMKYARIRLSTFAGERPTRAQRTGRLVALLLSVLPVGLGLIWAVFDEDHLSWHDRLSQTYLRKG